MIFQAFFDRLRAEGIPVSLTEWMTLMQALERGAVEPDLGSFYRVARAILIKDEAYYDRYDRAFVMAFKDAEPPDDLLKRIVEAMEKAFAREFSEQEKAALKALDLEQVLKNFLEQLKQGNYHGHEGGNKAIGRRGTSTQGADGFNPAGIRIGQASGRHGKAIQIAEFRRFREYDANRVLDTRGMRVALARLKRMLPQGPADELDIERTIDRTAREGGEIELVFRPRKQNVQKVLLLTDVGGSMSGFAELVSRFFSAMKGTIKDLTHYYFHNCPYDVVYEDAARYRAVPLGEVIEKHKNTHLLVMVGDAAMAPSELIYPHGAIDMRVQNPRPGIDYLGDLATAFAQRVWLNPEPERYWDHTYTINMIRGVFPMFALTQDGIVAAVEHLMRRRRAA